MAELRGVCRHSPVLFAAGSLFLPQRSSKWPFEKQLNQGLIPEHGPHHPLGMESTQPTLRMILGPDA